MRHDRNRPELDVHHLPKQQADKRLEALITAEYGPDRAAAHRRFVPVGATLDAAVTAGRDVLTMFPPLAGACVMMSALLATHLQALSAQPAYVVAGALWVDGTRVFGRDTLVKDAAVFERSDPSWDGHAWVSFGDLLVDASIFRTARAPGAPPLLADVVSRRFGAGRGLLMGRIDEVERLGFHYEPQHVLSQGQLDRVVLGALKLTETPADRAS